MLPLQVSHIRFKGNYPSELVCSLPTGWQCCLHLPIQSLALNQHLNILNSLCLPLVFITIMPGARLKCCQAAIIPASAAPAMTSEISLAQHGAEAFSSI